MADRDKVIRALHCCAHIDGSDCLYCPYNHNDEDCTSLMSMDVLELLKEQEAVEPEVEVLNEIDRLYRCPTCHKCFFLREAKVLRPMRSEGEMEMHWITVNSEPPKQTTFEDLGYVQVVRCKDCTYRGEINCPQYYRRAELSDEYYCADGERKTDDA